MLFWLRIVLFKIDLYGDTLASGQSVSLVLNDDGQNNVHTCIFAWVNPGSETIVGEQ